MEAAHAHASFRADWLNHTQAHPLSALGLAIAILAMAWLFMSSTAQVLAGEADIALRYGLLGGLAGFAATALGAMPGLFLRGISNRTEDTLLGLAAGHDLRGLPRGHPGNPSQRSPDPRYPGVDGGICGDDAFRHVPRLRA